MAWGKHLYHRYKSLGASTPQDHLGLLNYGFIEGRFRGWVEEYRYRGEPDDLIILKLEDNWECTTAKELGAPGPAAHLERGVVAGLLQEATGRTVKVEETRCIAKNDPHCELKITFQD